jgi:NADPH-dependent 2,4-dienoyl-CoA reductase/sulfur reductase-like enzyme
MNTPSNVLVVGASVAGLGVAEALRREGYAGAVTLLGAEKHLPYDRPPLSKKVLSGEVEPERVQLRPASALVDLGAELVLDDAAVGFDVATRTVRTASDRRLSADAVVIATGLEPRRLREHPRWAGVHSFRTLDDALALRAELTAGSPRLVVVGDGVLGAEIAATARGMGVAVTLVGPQNAPLESHLGAFVGAQLATLHAERGVDVRLGVAVDSLVGDNDRVRGVVLVDGTEIAADIVVVAIGSTPAIGWLEGSGLELADGVVCDSHCRAAAGVYAVGDIARWYHEGLRARVRLENRTHAVESAMAVAANLVGKERVYTPTPYFWTDQFDAKIQVYGFVSARCEIKIVEGDPARRQFVALYGDGEKVTGLLGWNMVKQIRAHRRHLAEATAWDAITAVT